MNLPARAAVQSRGMSGAQLQRIARVRDRLMGLADDHAADAYSTGPDPLFGTVSRRVRMLLQQPIQYRPRLSSVFGFHQLSHFIISSCSILSCMGFRLMASCVTGRA